MVASSPDDPRRSRRWDGTATPRTAAVWDVVQRTIDGLHRDALVVLDVGGGTGGLAVPLAALGHTVTVIDPSPDALAALARRADEAGVQDRVQGVQADAAQLAEVVAPDSVDLVCCHEVLEYVEDPHGALAAVASVMRTGGAASLLVAQRSAAVLSRALAGRFLEAAHALEDPQGRWGATDPLPRRFDRSALIDLVEASGMTVQQVQGVRLFTDLVPESMVDGDDARAALLELEREAGDHTRHPSLAVLAAQLHIVARLASG